MNKDKLPKYKEQKAVIKKANTMNFAVDKWLNNNEPPGYSIVTFRGLTTKDGNIEMYFLFKRDNILL